MRGNVCAITLIVCLTAIAPAAGDTPRIESGDGFLARNPESRADYVAGLSDQLLQLHRAGLLRGFHWYERCIGKAGHDTMAETLADYIGAEPSRAREPAARNLIWAAAEVCAYP